MDWPVVLTRQAERDLAEIVRFIARDDYAAAQRMGNGLIARTESLSRQPRLGIPVQGWKQVRALLHRRYYVVYRCDEKTQRLEVLRFWHSARDLGALKLRELES